MTAWQTQSVVSARIFRVQLKRPWLRLCILAAVLVVPAGCGDGSVAGSDGDGSRGSGEHSMPAAKSGTDAEGAHEDGYSDSSDSSGSSVSSVIDEEEQGALPKESEEACAALPDAEIAALTSISFSASTERTVHRIGDRAPIVGCTWRSGSPVESQTSDGPTLLRIWFAEGASSDLFELAVAELSAGDPGTVEIGIQAAYEGFDTAGDDGDPGSPASAGEDDGFGEVDGWLVVESNSGVVIFTTSKASPVGVDGQGGGIDLATMQGLAGQYISALEKG
ncbi:MAG TPA: hypothetical protein DEG43_00320 [Acidimicrobiaceae bacterium]|nr:hypothetical protein [Acidimicrobiaceae bacterium]